MKSSHDSKQLLTEGRLLARQVALSMAWFVLYLLNLRRGFKMLLRQSYTGYLDANISIRLQVMPLTCDIALVPLLQSV